MEGDPQSTDEVDSSSDSRKGAESLHSSIHNYISSFNKDVVGAGDGSFDALHVESGQFREGQSITGLLQQDGQYFQVEGQESSVYFHPSDPKQLTFVVSGSHDSDMNEGSDGKHNIDQSVQEHQSDTSAIVLSSGHKTGGLSLLKMDSNCQLVAVSSDDHHNQTVLLNTGDDNYQTVTIMPTGEINTGDSSVSYVLIVSPQDGEVGRPLASTNLLTLKDDFSAKFYNPSEAQSKDGDKSKHETFVRVITGENYQDMMCDYCEYSSPKRYLMARHMKSHSEERPHKCSICGHSFKTAASLTNHINTHSGIRPHKCKECDSAFTTSGELVRHMRYKHTFEKPHKCNQCDYASVELSKMKRHMRSHTGERPYQCSECTYASPDTYKLKRHMRIHTGEKPYACDVCQAKFTQSNSLKAHKLIHTGNKPVFQCELCPATCGRKTDMRIHMQKLHSSEGQPMECKKCHKLFSDRYNYKLHIKTHDGERSFKCALCAFAALTESRLEEHLLLQHDDHRPYQCGHSDCREMFRYRGLLRHHKIFTHGSEDFQPLERIHECSCGKKFVLESNMFKHEDCHDQNTHVYNNVLVMKDVEDMDDIGEDFQSELTELFFPVNLLPMDSLTNSTSLSLIDDEASTSATSENTQRIETAETVKQMIHELETENLVMRRIVKEVDGHRVVVMEVGPARGVLNSNMSGTADKDLVEAERFESETELSHDSAVQILYDIAEGKRLHDNEGLVHVTSTGNVVTLQMEILPENMMGSQEQVGNEDNVDDEQGQGDGLEHISLLSQSPQELTSRFVKRHASEDGDFDDDHIEPKKLRTDDI